MTSFELFEKNYREAVENIKQYLHRPEGAYDYEFADFAKWLLETDSNPYTFIDAPWAECFDSAEDFADLLNTLHHALYDDGEITFILSKDRPRIKLQPRWEIQESESIEILDITPKEFCMLQEKKAKEEIRRFFLIDAKKGVEWAAKHYNMYSCWEDSWIEEAKQRYAK